MALVNFQDVSLSFGGPILLDSVNLQIHPGEKISLLGRNGAGKSTFMKIVHGSIEPDSGRVIKSSDLKTAILPQDIPDGIYGSVYNVLSAGDGDYSAVEQGHIQQIEKVISLMNLDPEPEFSTLSAGMKRRVLLGQALVSDPDIILLDEPTNHLDIDSIKWLEDFLSKYDKTVFFVTHDRAFLQKVAVRILEIDRGRLFDWKCDYSTFLKRKEAWLESEGAQNALFDKKLAREEAWIRKGIKARRTRNEGRVRALKQMRLERGRRLEREGNVKLELNSGERSGKLVIEAENITFSYDEKHIVDSFSTTLLRGDRIGVMGPNGCGKSTLIKLLLGELKPATGSVRLGTNLETAYSDQLRDTLDEEKSIRQNVTDGNEIIEVNGKNRHIIGYLQDFLFAPDRVDEKVRVLSGGERNRLLLARLFAKPFNLLVMDEPTNDLDLETVELLEDVLSEYQGTILLVSHDREFLNNVVTSTIVFEGEGKVSEYAGGYDDWLYQRKETPEVKPEKVKAQIREKKPSSRMSYKENREYESIPDEIALREKKRDELTQLLSDPEFYKSDAKRSVEVNREIEEIESGLEALYDRWMELEDKMKNQ